MSTSMRSALDSVRKRVHVVCKAKRSERVGRYERHWERTSGGSIWRSDEEEDFDDGSSGKRDLFAAGMSSSVLVSATRSEMDIVDSCVSRQKCEGLGSRGRLEGRLVDDDNDDDTADVGRQVKASLSSSGDFAGDRMEANFRFIDERNDAISMVG
mmetsp:Transcript_30589/g.61141  ORF Transcript_30589/g.61141 Transcript_30589/m.61141 type:complete len:155 (-) Transcript_30589:130-594(-)